MQDLKGRLAASHRARGQPSGRARGQGLVEFALVIPILFLIAAAIGDFGRVYVSLIAVEDAAREAADYTAFDDVSASHFSTTASDPTCTDPGGVCVTPSTRVEALRRACAAVKALPDYGAVAATCADPTSTCAATPGGFCQLQLEDYRPYEPWLTTCDPANPTPQPDASSTCGWVVHVTVTFDFHTIIDLPPLPSTVTIVRDSRYAVSALPSGA